MRIQVTNHQSDRVRLYEGTSAHVVEQLLFDFPWLRPNDPDAPRSVGALVERLNSTQSFDVDVLDGDLAKSEKHDPAGLMHQPIVADMVGFQPENTPSFRAARFLASIEVSAADIRQALYDEDGHIDRAALRAYGLPVTEDSLKALRAVVQMQGDALQKAEPVAAHASSVVAGHSEGQDVAEALLRAYKDSFVFPVVLGGKHSGGAMLAHDDQTATWLLKPGSNGAGVAAGASQEGASQAQREAAWYQIAKEWGLFNWFPRAELVLIDGKQFAAMQLLPWSYKSLAHRQKTEPNIGPTVFQSMLEDGVVHQLAAMSFILGSPDEHANNCMIGDDHTVRFIDHGSAFAGPAFDPANDKASFIPCQLRAWAPLSVNFHQLDEAEKLRMLPRAPAPVSARVGKWLAGLAAGPLEALCGRYGIDPRPQLERLAQLKSRALEKPSDLAINELWAKT